MSFQDETGDNFNWIYVMLGDFVSILFVVSSTIRLFIYYKYNAEIRGQIESIGCLRSRKKFGKKNMMTVEEWSYSYHSYFGFFSFLFFVFFISWKVYYKAQMCKNSNAYTAQMILIEENTLRRWNACIIYGKKWKDAAISLIN